MEGQSKSCYLTGQFDHLADKPKSSPKDPTPDLPPINQHSSNLGPKLVVGTREMSLAAKGRGNNVKGVVT